MKKIVTILAVLSMMLSAVQPAVLPAFASEARADAAAEESAPAAGEIAASADTPLFFGRTDQEKETGMFAEPDAESKLICGIPVGCYFHVFDAGKEGWYRIQFGTVTGFVQAESVTEVTGKENLPLMKAAGSWVSEMDGENLPSMLTVRDDGSCVYQVMNKTFTGILDLDETPVDGVYTGTLRCLLADSEGNYHEEDCPMNLDAGGPVRPGDTPQRFVRFDFMPVLESIMGVWSEVDADGNRIGQLTVERDCTFTCGEQSGAVAITAEPFADDMYAFWCGFYLPDGSFWEGVGIGGENIENDMYTGQDAGRHFVREAQIPALTLADAVGVWLYEPVPMEGFDLSKSAAIGSFDVKDDGSFLYTDFETGRMETGTVKLEYEEYADGAKVAWFIFYKADGTFWLGCHKPADADYYMGIGQDDTSFLLSYDYAIANGFNSEETGITPIVGTWVEDNELDPLTMTITEDGKFELVFRGGGSYAGTVKAEKDGEGKPVYSFYDGETLLCSVPADSETLSVTHPVLGTFTFVRAETLELTLADAVGVWLYEPVPMEGFDLSKSAAIGSFDVKDDGSFLYTDFETGRMETGTVKLEYEEYADGAKVAWFIFYKADGTFWIGCHKPADTDYYMGIGQDDTSFLLSYDYAIAHGYNSEDAGITPIVGSWVEDSALDPVTMTITADGKFELVFKGGGSYAGTVKAEKDGEGKPVYSFYDGETLLCSVPADSETLSVTHPVLGTFTFVRAETLELTLADAVGVWLYEPVPMEGFDLSKSAAIGSFDVKDDGSFLYTDFETGRTETGTVKLEYEEYADGAKVAWFIFYKADGTFWLGCHKPADTDYYMGIGQDDTSFLLSYDYAIAHGYNSEETGIAPIVGTWVEDNELDPVTMTVTADGKFELVFRGGGSYAGTVKAEKDGSSKPIYSFYDGETLLCSVPADSETLSVTHPVLGTFTFVRAASTVQPLFGDANGDGKVSIEDAKKALDEHVIVNQVFGDPIITDETARHNADVNGDGKITEADAVAILKYVTMQSSMLEPSWYELTKNPNAPDAPAEGAAG